MQPVCTAGQALEQVARQITFDFQILPHDDGLEAGSTVDIGGEVHGVERTLLLRHSVDRTHRTPPAIDAGTQPATKFTHLLCVVQVCLRTTGG